MTDVEQWLGDLEDKAKFATPGPWVMDGVYPIYSVGRGGLKDKTIGHVQRQWDGDFIAAANPAAVLRLVGMVRHLAAGCDCDTEACQYGHCTPTCLLQMAYNATKDHHD